MLDVAKLVQAQHIILNKTTPRIEILKQDTGRTRFGRKILRVYRNHNFELMAPVLPVFGSFSGFEIETLVGSYDDSMAFNEHTDAHVDAEILWFDFSRFELKSDTLAEFVVSRVKALRQFSGAPILICDHPSSDYFEFNNSLADSVKEIPDIFVFPISEIAQEMGDGFYDHARAAHFGTTFHSSVFLASARLLGLKYLPAIFRPRIKAIAIDLDNTLYNGVLGEDGADGVIMTEGHRRLQECLVKLGESGVLLSITSKNVEQDVDNLFSLRKDFPLRPEHLAGKQVNWDGKAGNIRKLAEAFNISPNDFLLLDDNPGEIGQVVADIGLIDVMHASDDADVTVAELNTFPGLFSFYLTNADLKRTHDVIARQHRMEQQRGQSVEQYLEQMETSLGIYLHEEDAFKRLCEIPLKTNQFNLALQRLSATQVRSYFDESNAFIVSLSLKDKLSNSGNVGALYGHLEEDVLVVDEVCVSCRALGRGIEDFMIVRALDTMVKAAPVLVTRIRFCYRLGPRNQPAINWLKKFTQMDVSCELDCMENETSRLDVMDYPISKFQTYLESTRDFPVKVFLQTSF